MPVIMQTKPQLTDEQVRKALKKIYAEDAAYKRQRPGQRLELVLCLLLLAGMIALMLHSERVYQAPETHNSKGS